jgi:dUTP pyrophosphatase
MNTLKIKILNNDLIEYYTNLTYYHQGDAGIDLINGKISQVKEHQYKIDFQIQTEMLENNKNISYLLVPRSSIVKTDFRMSNSIGIIDAGYRGNLMAFVDNIYHTDNHPKENERYFQLIRADLQTINNIEIVEELSETSRGNGGFGSTNLIINNL